MKINPVHLTDGYKVSHKDQYPAGITKIYSNLTPRESKIPGISKVVAFGIQGFIKERLIEDFNREFFSKQKDVVVSKYQRRLDNYLGKGAVNTDHIAALHDLGYLPLHIKAAPEGSLVNIRVPVLTITNTKPEFFWLTNFLETLLSCELWFMMNSATIAFEYRKLIQDAVNKTSDQDFMPSWIGHDFSMRGMMGVEAASKSGAAHLLSFTGTDTVPAMDYLEEYYNANSDTELLGGSVPATEHSVACLNGTDEESTIKRLLKVYPIGLLSYVADTWDYFQMLTKILPKVKNGVMSRNGKLVVRPDCYDDQTQILTDSGWKFFKDLNINDLVAQVRHDGTYEFTKPLKYVDQDYSGEMYRFFDDLGKLDLLVTPNHRMIFIKNNEFLVEEAKLTKVGAWKKDMVRSASSQNLNKSLTDMERLKIAFQADGSYTTSGGKIRFSFSKQRKINRLKNILNNEKISYKIYDLNDGRVEFNIDSSSDLFSKNFDWFDISNLCSHWCQEFIEELSYWDATRRSENRFKFDTTNKSVIEKVELVALSAGYGTIISEKEDNRSEKFSKVYTAHIMKNNKLGGQSQNKEVIQYSGKIYCVTVPTGMILVKRNRSVVICGNSGDPVKVVCGDLSAPVGSPEYKGSVELLWETFGGTVNSKGFKQLDDHIGLIYGDSITLDRAKRIFDGLAEKGFASTNVVFGIGSFSYQYNTRDTLGFAMKATYGIVNGSPMAVFKKPKTDNGMKNSAKGLLFVDSNGVLHEDVSPEEEAREDGLLTTVFLDGKLTRETTLQEIRSRLAENLNMELGEV